MPILIVSLVIGIIMVTAVILPLSSEYSEAKTFTNEGYFYLQKITSEDDYTFVWDATEPTKYIINDEELTFENTSGLSLSVVLGETFAARLNQDMSRISFYSGGNFVNTSDEYPEITISYTGGTLTVTNTNVTRTYSVDEFYTIAESGDYVMKKSGSVAHLLEDSEIYGSIFASGQTYNGANNIWWHIGGTIDTIEWPDEFNSNLTVSNKVIHGSENPNYIGLYDLDYLTFTAVNTAEVTFNVTASYFVVPAEVTADPDNPAAYKSLVMVIPLMAFVVLVVAAAAMIYYKKD